MTDQEKEWVYYRTVCEACYPPEGRSDAYRLRLDDALPEDSSSTHKHVKLTDTEIIVLKLEGLGLD